MHCSISDGASAPSLTTSTFGDLLTDSPTQARAILHISPHHGALPLTPLGRPLHSSDLSLVFLGFCLGPRRQRLGSRSKRWRFTSSWEASTRPTVRCEQGVLGGAVETRVASAPSPLYVDCRRAPMRRGVCGGGYCLAIFFFQTHTIESLHPTCSRACDEDYQNGNLSKAPAADERRGSGSLPGSEQTAHFATRSPAAAAVQPCPPPFFSIFSGGLQGPFLVAAFSFFFFFVRCLCWSLKPWAHVCRLAPPALGAVASAHLTLAGFHHRHGQAESSDDDGPGAGGRDGLDRRCSHHTRHSHTDVPGLVVLLFRLLLLLLLSDSPTLRSRVVAAVSGAAVQRTSFRLDRAARHMGAAAYALELMGASPCPPPLFFF